MAVSGHAPYTAHLLLDLRQVLVGELRGDVEIVVKAAVNPRADRDLGVFVEALNCHGEDVRGGVADAEEPVGFVRGGEGNRLDGEALLGDLLSAAALLLLDFELLSVRSNVDVHSPERCAREWDPRRRPRGCTAGEDPASHPVQARSFGRPAAGMLPDITKKVCIQLIRDLGDCNPQRERCEAQRAGHPSAKAYMRHRRLAVRSLYACGNRVANARYMHEYIAPDGQLPIWRINGKFSGLRNTYQETPHIRRA